VLRANPVSVTVVESSPVLRPVMTSEWAVLSLQGWGMILWLAVANTAFAFTLWNRTLRSLSATKSATISNTMLVQIAVLAQLFLGETRSTVSIVGVALAAVGALLVQARKRSATSAAPSAEGSI